MFCGDVVIFLTCLYFFFSWLKAEMKLYSNSDTSVIRHHYEKKLLEMEHEKKILQVIGLWYDL